MLESYRDLYIQVSYVSCHMLNIIKTWKSIRGSSVHVNALIERLACCWLLSLFRSTDTVKGDRKGIVEMINYHHLCPVSVIIIHFKSQNFTLMPDTFLCAESSQNFPKTNMKQKYLTFIFDVKSLFLALRASRPTLKFRYFHMQLHEWKFNMFSVTLLLIIHHILVCCLIKNLLCWHAVSMCVWVWICLCLRNVTLCVTFKIWKFTLYVTLNIWKLWGQCGPIISCVV